MWNSLIRQRRKLLLWVVSGPSGSGKTTLCKKLLGKKGLNLVRSISYTTRPLRKKEKNNRDYIFVSRAEFSRMIKKGELLEWQETFGNLYGTSKKLVRRSFAKNKDVLLSIDVKGALVIKRKMPKQAVFIFIIPPSEQHLIKRIKIRAREGSKEIKKRLKHAKFELKFAKRYDYIVINDTVSKATKELEAIITAKRLENV